VTTALDRMLARKGRTLADFAGRGNNRTKMGRIFRRKGVAHGSDFDRIATLPRRRWQEDPGLEQLRLDLTDWLKTPSGGMELRPVQAASLMELHDYGGLFGPQYVGAGKTLLSFLAPTVVGVERPLLLIPAKLRRKTEREFEELARHWLRHPDLRILTYEKLSRDGGWEELKCINPDMIVADEVHRLKAKQAGCTRKVRRWMEENPGTKFCALSGTITTRSLREYAHILRWCLPNHSPLPHDLRALSDWADALDEKVDPKHRLNPGVLLELCTPQEVQQGHAEGREGLTHAARHGFRRRLTETHGVVATEAGYLGSSLSIQALKIQLPPDASGALDEMRRTQETPTGEPIAEPVDLWRHARELACGFVYRWDPTAPEDWLAVRKEWARFVREALGRGVRGLDTEFQVAKACKRGDLERGAYDAWVAVRGGFKPNSVADWIHDATTTAAIDWLRRPEPGLCWVEHVAFGKKLSHLSGIPYFQQNGEDGKGNAIEQHQGAAILSIAANNEGRNLQAWNRNLIVSCPPNGRVLEQLMGRTHRDGQRADEVTVEIGMACIEQWNALEQARADASYIEATTGQAQKLCYADVDVPGADEVKQWAGNDPAWRQG